eukprot:SAG31_NODE_14718_length_791_cov_0.859827_1_plen_54_part_01
MDAACPEACLKHQLVQDLQTCLAACLAAADDDGSGREIGVSENAQVVSAVTLVL